MRANVNIATRQAAPASVVHRATPVRMANAVMMQARPACLTVIVARTTAVAVLAAMPAKPVSAPAAAQVVRCAALPVAVPRAKPVSAVPPAAQPLRCAVLPAVPRGNTAAMVSALPTARPIAVVRRAAPTAVGGAAEPVPAGKPATTAPAVTMPEQAARQTLTAARTSAAIRFAVRRTKHVSTDRVWDTVLTVSVTTAADCFPVWRLAQGLTRPALTFVRVWGERWSTNASPSLFARSYLVSCLRAA